MGPNTRIITSQPGRGPIGQRDPGGGVQEPDLALKVTCSSGKIQPQIRMAQASRGFMG